MRSRIYSGFFLLYTIAFSLQYLAISGLFAHQIQLLSCLLPTDQPHPSPLGILFSKELLIPDSKTD